MNLLRGELSGGSLRIDEFTAAAPEGSGPVNLGVRPENFLLSDSGLPMQVKVVEPTGSETIVLLSFQGQDVTAVFRQRHAFSPGETVHLMPDTNHLHFFDIEAGTRL